MKTIIFLLLGIILYGCCPSIDSTSRTTITIRDTVYLPNPILDSMLTSNAEFLEWYYSEVGALRAENDRLMGRAPDTVRVKEYVQSTMKIPMGSCQGNS